MSDVFTELRRRKAALNHIRDFITYMAPSGHPDYANTPAAHHELILDAFERVVKGDLKKLMIFLPPGAAKSTYLRILCAWILARDPSTQMLRVMATQHLAERQARMLRSAVQEPQFERLSGAKLLPDMQAAAAFGLNKGAAVISGGVQTSIQGLRMAYGILDDVVPSWDACYSESWRAGTMDWLWSEFMTRRLPDAPLIWVNTRWHELDPPGQVLKAEDDWEVIRLPLLAEDDCPLGREPGERLWPQWYTDQMVEEAQRNPEIWAGLWQQRPYQQTGDFFTADDFEIVDDAPHGCAPYASIDLAMTEKQASDATAILTAVFSPEGTLYLTGCHEHRCSPEATLTRLQSLHDTHKFRELLIEDSPAEKVFRDFAHKVFRQQGRPLPLVQMPTRGRDKQQRAQSARGLAKMGAIKLVAGPWNSGFIRQCTEFPYGRHEDAVDALALLAQRAAKMAPGAPPPQSAPAQPPQGAITQNEHGQMHTAATLNDLFHERDEVLSAARRTRRI